MSDIFCEPLDCSLQALLPTGFLRQEYWSGLPFPSPGHLPDSGIQLASPSLQTDSLQLSHLWVGEGSGSPLQCSCLENPRDGGAWWAAVYGVPQSQTRLKQPRSSSTFGLVPFKRFIHLFTFLFLLCKMYLFEEL